MLGVDVAASLGLAATAGLRFFRPATVGAFGGCAALSKLMGFDAEQLQHAFAKPMMRQAHVAKFVDNAAAAARPLRRDQAEKLVESSTVLRRSVMSPGSYTMQLDEWYVSSS